MCYFLSDFPRAVVTLLSTSQTTPAVVNVAHVAATTGAAENSSPHASSVATHTPVTAHARFQLFWNPKILAKLSCTPSHTRAIGATA